MRGITIAHDHAAEMKFLFALWISFIASAETALAQSRDESATRRPVGTDALVAWATV